jgi:hypothetical protein
MILLTWQTMQVVLVQDMMALQGLSPTFGNEILTWEYTTQQT